MADPCINGRINPSSQIKLRLFADSGGHCNRPQCHRYLFSDLDVADYHFGEMAHIIAASDDGPRGDTSLEAETKAEYNNLILLCPSCHTEIDKAPDIFPVNLILDWKANHKKRILETISIPKKESRKDARTYLLKELRKNKMIFDSFNPNLPYRENPQAEEAVVWKRKMLSQIIPNNQKILLFLDFNVHLLDDEELIIVEEFRQHLDDLIERHVGENKSVATRFPEAMNKILH